MRSKIALMGITVMLAGALAACSSSSNASATSSSSGSTATGKPIILATNSSESGNGYEFQDIDDGFSAWAKQLNAHGGINGRPVKVQTCNDGGDATGNESCAQQQIQNSSVVGVTGASAFVTAGAETQYATSGLAYVPAFPFAPGDYSESALAPIPAGMATYAAMPEYLAKTLHIKDMAFIVADQAATQQIQQIAKASAAAGGAKITVIPEPLTQSDFVPAMTQAVAAGAKAILWGHLPTDIPNLISAAQTAGYSGPFVASAGDFYSGTLPAINKTGVSWYTTFDFLNQSTDPSLKSYRSAMAAAGHTSEVDANSADGYQVGLIFEAALKKLGSNITRSSLNKALKTDNFNNVPGYPSVVGRSQAPKGNPAFVSLGNATTFIVKYQNGKFTYPQNRTNFASVLVNVK